MTPQEKIISDINITTRLHAWSGICRDDNSVPALLVTFDGTSEAGSISLIFPLEYPLAFARLLLQAAIDKIDEEVAKEA